MSAADNLGQQALLKVGDALELKIDRMAHGGEGIGNAPDGRVVFVQGHFLGMPLKRV